MSSRVDFDAMRAALIARDERLAAIVCAAPFLYSFDGLEADQRERLEQLQERYLALRIVFQTGYNQSDFRLAYSRRPPHTSTAADGLRRVAWVLPRIQATLSRASTGWLHHGQIRRYSVDNPALRPG